MELSTAIWMIVFLAIIVGPFVYFSNLAFSNEKDKEED